jgi:ATP-dependent DNA helicase RecG
MSGGISLNDRVQFLRGVGPVRAREFEKLGVLTVGDLIAHFPFRFEHKPKSRSIGQLEEGVVCTVVGRLSRLRHRGLPGKEIVSGQLLDGTGRCRIRWFHSSYLKESLSEGMTLRITGKVDVDDFGVFFTHPEWSVVPEAENPFEHDADRYEPVYPATAGLASREIAGLVRRALEAAGPQVVDPLPATLRAKRRLPPLRTSIERFHQPTQPADAEIARRRLAYDELLLCQLAVQRSRARHAKAMPILPLPVSDALDLRIRRRFPFELTSAQLKAAADIRSDLASGRPMNRLLQADVGAGKTAIAVYAALAVVAHKKQAAIAAPTEVLAEQHFEKLHGYLRGSRVHMALLTGSTSAAERRRVLGELAAGSIDIVAGTHALLEDDVRFRACGLMVIDEQHKFGVTQRARLRMKAESPHLLVLTATPIPRTLAMTLFGDLDVTVMAGVPPGRRVVETRIVESKNRDAAWRFIRERVVRGERAYIVYPLVEESEDLPLRAAKSELSRLQESELAGCHTALLHGRMSGLEKSRVVEEFRKGGIQALVCTTVIEVGVDVPEATIMAVQHAERFGLTQLHQLRGRVGRGDRKSFCLLFSESRGEPAARRLDVMCRTTDGFEIAEEDLKLRGPGELPGTRQHGVPTLKVADLLRDAKLLENARDDAAGILLADPDLADPVHSGLRDALERRFGFGLANSAPPAATLV